MWSGNAYRVGGSDQSIQDYLCLTILSCSHSVKVSEQPRSMVSLGCALVCMVYTSL